MIHFDNFRDNEGPFKERYARERLQESIGDQPPTIVIDQLAFGMMTEITRLISDRPLIAHMIWAISYRKKSDNSVFLFISTIECRCPIDVQYESYI